jgi:histidinol-phosphatase (PHP family)
VEEYAEAAFSKNLAGIHITCHTPLPEGFSPHVRMRLDEMDLYFEIIQEVREKFQGRLEIGTGLECDYLPELEPWIAQMRARRPWSHFLGSVHPQTAEFKKSYSQGGVIENITRYFQLVAKSAESGFFDTLGHPDLIKNEYPEVWKVGEVISVICKTLDRIAATGVAMEMNTSGWNKAIPEVNPGFEILLEMAKRMIPVVWGADALRPTRVGDRFLDGLQLLEEAGYQEVGLQEPGRRRMILIEEARKSLDPGFCEQT